MSSNGHLLILVQLAACAYKGLCGDKQQLNQRERERKREQEREKQLLLKKLVLGNTTKPYFYCMCNVISYRIQAIFSKVANTDHLSILGGIELDVIYTVQGHSACATVMERHMVLAWSKLNTSRGQSCTGEQYLVCGYTVLLEFSSG